MQLKPIWLPRVLSYFAETRQFGVLDRIANALGANQALAALYDALRVYRSNCLGDNPDKECPRARIKQDGEERELGPAELLEKAEYELNKIAEMLLDRELEEEGLRVARTVALLALGAKTKQ